MSTDTERNLSERQKEERIAQAEFEQYAKEHNLFVCTFEQMSEISQSIKRGLEDVKSGDVSYFKHALYLLK